jgi:hypothetical protein
LFCGLPEPPSGVLATASLADEGTSVSATGSSCEAIDKNLVLLRYARMWMDAD